MIEEGKIRVQLNFLGPHIKKEDIAKILSPKSKGEEEIFDFHRGALESFIELPLTSLSEEILERYVEVTDGIHTPILPAFERLLKPLKSAKRNYCLGDYTATIASCGIVGEMLAILIWQANELTIKGRPITEAIEKDLFGRSYENLGQTGRLRILKAFEFISELQHQKFVTILNSRRPYMHLWTADFQNERRDALTTYKTSSELIVEITGIGIADAGTAKINPLLIKFLKEQS